MKANIDIECRNDIRMLFENGCAVTITFLSNYTRAYSPSGALLYTGYVPVNGVDAALHFSLETENGRDQETTLDTDSRGKSEAR